MPKDTCCVYTVETSPHRVTGAQVSRKTPFPELIVSKSSEKLKESSKYPRKNAVFFKIHIFGQFTFYASIINVCTLETSLDCATFVQVRGKTQVSIFTSSKNTPENEGPPPNNRKLCISSQNTMLESEPSLGKPPGLILVEVCRKLASFVNFVQFSTQKTRNSLRKDKKYNHFI